MAFQALLRFAGLCAHVPNAALDSGPTKLWVVMPNATNPIKQPTICKHWPGLLVDAKHVSGVGLGSGKLFRDLARKEVTLEPEGAGGIAVAKLSVPKGDPTTDFRDVPNLAEIAPKAAKIHPDFLKDAESASFLIARVIVEKGKLQGLSRKKNQKVYFPNGSKYATKETSQAFCHDTVVDLGKLDRLTIRLRHLDTGATESVVVAGGTAKREVLFGNLCGELWIKELGGPPPYPPEGKPAATDDDFEQIYILSYPALANDPKGPLPTWKTFAGGDTKCHQGIFAPYTGPTP